MNKILYKILLTCLFIFSLSPIFSQDYFGQLNFPASTQPQAIAIDLNDNMYISQWSVGLLKSTDYGLTFDTLNVGLKNKFITDILCTADGAVYLATFGGGVFKSSNQGNLWTEINTGLTNKKINCLTVTYNGTLVAGTQGDGIFISTNKGANWTISNKGLQYKAISAISASKLGTILAGTYGCGVYVSKDNGNTWKSSNSGLKNLFISKLVVNNSSEFYAATMGGGVFLSISDGINWKQIPTDDLENYNISAIISTENADRPLIIGYRLGGIKFYGFDVIDFKWNWRETITSIGVVTGFARDRSNKIYVISTSNKILSTSNFGKVWLERGIIKYDLPNQMSTNNSGYLTGKFSYNFDSTYFSSNYGESWETTNLPIDFVDTTYYANVDSIDFYAFNKRFSLVKTVKTNENKFITAGSQGLFSSLDGINYNTDEKFKNKRISTFDYLNGFMIFYKDSIHIPSGPGDVQPPINPEIMKSTDNGSTFSPVTMPPGNGYVYKLKIADNGNIFCVKTDLNIPNAHLSSFFFRSTNNGSSWYRIEYDTTLGLINDFDISKTNEIYLITPQHIHYSTNFGNSWIKKIILYNYDTLGLSKINISKNDFIYILGTFKNISSYQQNSIWYTKKINNDFIPLIENLNASIESTFGTDDQNNVYYLGNALYKHLDSTMLTAPMQILPQTSKEGLPLLPKLNWTSDKFAELYEVQMSDYQNFDYLKDYSVQRDTIYTLTDSLAFNTDYFWRVRSKWHGTYSAWSETRKFSTLLNAPLLISPPDKSTGVDFQPTLVWHKVKKAQIYELQVSENTQFSTFAFKKDSLTDSLLIKVPLKADKSYFWRVRAKNESSTSPWSEIWNFKTTFEAPILISPINDSIDVPVKTKLVWGQVLNSNYYNILLSKKSDFSGETPTKVQNTTEFPVSLDYDTKYFWKASVGNNLGESPYSLPWSFLTTIEPIILISPDNNALNQPLKANLQWEQNQKYKNYEILLSETNDFETLELDSILNKESVNTAKLKSYQKYFWKVKVKTNTRNGEWSEIRSFTTSVDLPILRYPKNNTTELPNILTLLWFPVDGAEYYFLQVAKDEDFNNLIISKDSIYATLFEIKEELSADTKYFWRVRASNSVGFSEWSEIWNFTTKVVSVKDVNQVVQISPNPATDYINIDILFLPMQESAIQIFDIFGKIVLTVDTQNFVYLQRIDVSGLSAGLYFVRIGNAKPLKFVKM